MEENKNEVHQATLDEYRRQHMNELNTRWRHEHPARSAAITIRSAARKAEQYPETGMIIMPRLVTGSAEEIEAQLIRVREFYEKCVENGWTGGAAN